MKNKKELKSLIAAIGRLDPSLYVTPPPPEFLVNVALKYSIIDNTISVILFKCIPPVLIFLNIFYNIII